MKNPLFIIITLFLLSYILVNQFSNQQLSDQPLNIQKNNPPKILMLSTQSCQYCKQTRAFFEKHNLAYTEKDIEIDEEARRVYDLMNGQGTPLLIINGKIIHGYDEKIIRDAL